MKSVSLMTLAVSVIGAICTGAQAQSDLCCMSAKIEGQAVTLRTAPESPAECKTGSSNDGWTVCASFKDEQNSCPAVSDEDACTRCGYFWTGKACMLEDPVKKAKKQLEEEAKKKAEKTDRTEKPAANASPTPIP